VTSPDVSDSALSKSETIVVAIAWALVIAGVLLFALTVKGYTRTVVDNIDVWRDVGVERQEATELAEMVRAYVVGFEAVDLPMEWDGRPAFDERAVSHLDDVRTVLGGARSVLGAAATLLVVWLGYVISRKRWHEAGRVISAGGWLCIGSAAVTVPLGLADFGWLFERFHGLFFASGSWTFPEGDMLVGLFPIPFWVISGTLWVSLVACGGVLSVWIGHKLQRAA